MTISPPPSRKAFFVTDSQLRPSWRLLLYLPLLALAVFLTMQTSTILMNLNSYTLISLIRWTVSLIGIIVIFVLSAWIYLRFLDKREWATFGLDFRGPWFRDLGLGILLGAALVSAIFTVEWRMGWFNIRAFAWDILPPKEFWILLCVAFIGTIAAAVLAEISFRGYLLQTLQGWLGTPAAVIITSLLFGFLHLLNADVGGRVIYFVPFALTLFGVMLACAYLARHSLWLPIGLHFAWDFCEYHVFGLAGQSSDSTPLLMTSRTGWPFWAGYSHSSFGPEIGLLGVLAMLLGIGFLCWISKHKSIPLISLLGLFIVALGVSLTSERSRWPAPYPSLPATAASIQPLPSYAVVYPKPGATIHLTETASFMILKPDDPLDTTFNIPVDWLPGYVCVTLTPIGYYYETDIYPERLSLSLNGTSLEQKTYSSGILGFTLITTFADGTQITRDLDGGPWGICWSGPWKEGYYIAEFQVEDDTYTWWYKIEP